MIRNLDRADLSAMLGVLARSIPQGPASESILFEKTFGAFDYIPELNLGDFEGQNLRGFACGCVFAKRIRTGIRLLVVDPGYRERGVGSNLLRTLEERLIKTGSIAFIQAAATPGNYFNPGIDPSDMAATCFLEKAGYTVVDVAQNLTAECSQQRSYAAKLAALNNADFEVCRATSDHMVTLLDLVKQHFPQWLQEVRRAFLNDPVTIHICTKNGAIAGFACAESNNVGTGVLGPAGILPQYRGTGIGTVTLHRCVDDLRRLGFQRYSLQWTRFDLSLFARHQFGHCCRRTFWIYRKNLKADTEK